MSHTTKDQRVRCFNCNAPTTNTFYTPPLCADCAGRKEELDELERDAEEWIAMDPYED